MSDTDADGPGTRTGVVRATNPLPLNATTGAPALVAPTAKFPLTSDVVATTPSPVMATLAAPASVSASTTRPDVEASVGVGGMVGDAGVFDPPHDAAATTSGSTASPNARVMFVLQLPRAAREDPIGGSAIRLGSNSRR